MSWTPSADPWWDERKARRLALPAAPTLIEQDDERPIAGRILGPTGTVVLVVRHGPEPLPFGFQGAAA